VQEQEHADTRDEKDKNPAKRRQEKKERVDKPGPDTIDQDQEDAAHEKTPLDTPR